MSVSSAITHILEAVAVAVAQGDSSPRRLARRLGCSPSVVRRALHHAELPWLVEQMASKPLLATSLECRLERFAGQALDVVQTTMQSSQCEQVQVRCAGILLKALQQSQRSGEAAPAPSPELSPELLHLLRESERRM